MFETVKSKGSSLHVCSESMDIKRGVVNGLP